MFDFLDECLSNTALTKLFMDSNFIQQNFCAALIEALKAIGRQESDSPVFDESNKQSVVWIFEKFIPMACIPFRAFVKQSVQLLDKGGVYFSY